MTTFPNSPKLVKGRLVLIDADTARVLRIISLQYNADTLTRKFQAQEAGGESGNRVEPSRFKGPAVETINPDIPSTIDAAALCKMADRKQIVGAVLDGPLAFDNAISASAAQIKKIHSEVAGQADILLAPDLEAGNMVAKQLQYLAGADSAGIVLGTRVPIVLTSRADTVRTRLASIAVMALVAHARRKIAGAAHV